jgi:hypothetical protein
MDTWYRLTDISSSSDQKIDAFSLEINTCTQLQSENICHQSKNGCKKHTIRAKIYALRAKWIPSERNYMPSEQK